mmetsp:Transcript_12846/g.25907  ORF Transcript_12846/g.25907 Transcript_12846/m.25907 type:complete len:286 (-) Transcript_12846:124-981(-)
MDCQDGEGGPATCCIEVSDCAAAESCMCGCTDGGGSGTRGAGRACGAGGGNEDVGGSADGVWASEGRDGGGAGCGAGGGDEDGGGGAGGGAGGGVRDVGSVCVCGGGDDAFCCGGGGRAWVVVGGGVIVEGASCVASRFCGWPKPDIGFGLVAVSGRGGGTFGGDGDGSSLELKPGTFCFIRKRVKRSLERVTTGFCCARDDDAKPVGCVSFVRRSAMTSRRSERSSIRPMASMTCSSGLTCSCKRRALCSIFAFCSSSDVVRWWRSERISRRIACIRPFHESSV